ncbi:MAG: hypothetical protein M1365_11165 [Actinobacteria bacterium]|nr:hypothetical protein [Actinomycetota bacterium]
MDTLKQKIECKVLKDPIFSTVLNERSGSQKRKEIIINIEKATGYKFASYVSLFFSAKGNTINPDDIQPFSDLLYSGDINKKLLLMINSPGGLPEVTEKMVELIRSKYEEFKVIVPNYAKSAATLLSFASDEIIMSDTSELGPIDPQMVRQDLKSGVVQVLPAHAYINSYNDIVKIINERGNLLPADIPILNNIDIAFIDRCNRAVEHSETLAKKWLSQNMFKGQDDKKAISISKYFARDKGLLSHSQVVGWKEAKSMGLNINYINRENDIGKLIWELYIRSELFLRETQQVKLFESNTCSIAIRVL